jgi:hypothetical protein
LTTSESILVVVPWTSRLPFIVVSLSRRIVVATALLPIVTALAAPPVAIFTAPVSASFAISIEPEEELTSTPSIP